MSKAEAILKIEPENELRFRGKFKSLNKGLLIMYARQTKLSLKSAQRVKPPVPDIVITPLLIHLIFLKCKRRKRAFKAV
jgi:hypothetical protein